VVRDKWTNKTKGYGFVSFANASDMTAALKELNGLYIFILFSSLIWNSILSIDIDMLGKCMQESMWVTDPLN
jgi:RNA recognition motif-containing protein